MTYEEENLRLVGIEVLDEDIKAKLSDLNAYKKLINETLNWLKKQSFAEKRIKNLIEKQKEQVEEQKEKIIEIIKRDIKSKYPSARRIGLVANYNEVKIYAAKS